MRTHIRSDGDFNAGPLGRQAHQRGRDLGFGRQILIQLHLANRQNSTWSVRSRRVSREHEIDVLGNKFWVAAKTIARGITVS